MIKKQQKCCQTLWFEKLSKKFISKQKSLQTIEKVTFLRVVKMPKTFQMWNFSIQPPKLSNNGWKDIQNLWCICGYDSYIYWFSKSNDISWIFFHFLMMWIDFLSIIGPSGSSIHEGEQDQSVICKDDDDYTLAIQNIKSICMGIVVEWDLCCNLLVPLMKRPKKAWENEQESD